MSDAEIIAHALLLGKCQNGPQYEANKNALESQTDSLVKRDRMLELAITWLPWLGATIIAFAIGAYGIGNKSYGIWIGYVGIIIAVLGFAFHLQKIVWESDRSDPARIMQRANIIIAKWDYRFEANQTIYARAEVANIGRTDATVIDDWSKISVGPNLPDDPAYGEHQTHIPIPHGQAFYVDMDRPEVILTEAHIDEIIEKKKLFYLWGKISYRNVFDEIWEYGFIMQFDAKRTPQGIAWRDISPGFPNYSFTRKRQ